MRCTKKMLLAATACAGVASLCASQARGDVLELTYEKLFLTGELAPGLVQNFTGFDAPVVSSSGRIGFYALFQDTVTQAGVWADSSGSFELAVRTGVTAPGTTDNLFTLIGLTNNRVAIGGDGHVTFQGDMDTAPSASDRGIWHGTPGALNLIAREGDATPAGGTYGINLGRVSIGADGSGAFAAPISGASGQSMFLMNGPAGAVQTLYVSGAQVPGEAAGVLYQGSASAIPPQVNASGQAAFLGALAGNATGAAIFLGPAGNAQVVAAIGRDAPDFDPSVDFDSFSQPDLNDTGSVVFTAGLSNFGNATATVGDAIFYGGVGTVDPVVRVGDTVAALAGITYGSFPTSLSPTTNDLGQIAFFATITGTGVVSSTDTVIMAGQVGDPEDLFVIGREGADLPESFSLMAGPLINNQGLIAFGITSVSDGAELWLANLETSELVRVIGTGDDASIVGLPSTPEEPILVSGLTLGNTTDGFRFLSDEGTLAFRLTFDDGSSGVFKVTTVIPEPAAGALLGLGVLALLARRRRI